MSNIILNMKKDEKKSSPAVNGAGEIPESIDKGGT